MKKLIIRCLLAGICLLSGVAAAAQTDIKAMSYNIRLDVQSDGDNRWDLRKEKVAGLMNYYEADFIGMQEVLHRQLLYLEEKLTGYDYVGVARDDGKQAGEYSCIFFKKDDYTIVKQSTFWLSPTPGSPSKGWDAALNRICTYGLFKHKKTKQRVWVFNTHFDHIGKEARLESAKLITQKIKELNTNNDPVVLMGDFNSRPEDPPVAHILSEMHNSRAISEQVHGPADTWNAFKFHEKPNGSIDYVFVSKDERIHVSKFITITDSYDLKYPSDHLPVMATIRIKNK